MDYLYAPWRGNYVRKKATNKDEKTSQHCVFCTKLQEKNDEQNFILKRFTYHAIILNLFPYNAGHLMIIPLEHVGRPADLNDKARLEFIELTAQVITILEQDLGAEGINAGLNLGKAAGAGIPTHLHMHIIPRWNGDTNFMPVIAQTKPISLDLKLVYQDLKPLIDKLNINLYKIFIR